MTTALDNWTIQTFSTLVTRILMPAARQHLNVLIFHRVRPVRDPLFPGEPDRIEFDRCMRMVAENFNCLPLDQAIDMLGSRQRLPKNAVAITFDDGYSDNRTEALPILQRHGLTATFFVASGFLDGGCMWNDEAIELVRNYRGDTLDLQSLGIDLLPSATVTERAALLERLLNSLKYREPAERRVALDELRTITGGDVPRDLMMTTAQVREMRDAGMGIGGHTVGHPILARIDLQHARREIGEDRERLTDLLGQPPDFLPTLMASPVVTIFPNIQR
ncbi:polysaccharide deacetylase family protein [Dechloromonas sp. A34]|uniref:polysaccharide deacetylase family protein n=1 Tax=Dechloromonas sp. A34 TaxID=447588 RepID=UPI002248CBFC|nr:polysaccharide deacetylase family protein [Dechloromonas sp. A34]